MRKCSPNSKAGIIAVVLACAMLQVIAQEKFTLSTSVTIDTPASTKSTTPSNAISTTKIPYQQLSCPKNAKIPIFSLPCYANKDCKVFGPGLACCKDRCIKGVLVPVNENNIRKTRLSNTLGESAKLTNSIEQQSAAAGEKKAVSPSEIQVPKVKKVQELVCPSPEDRVPIFSLPCDEDSDCRIFGRGLRCCNKKCLEGVATKPHSSTILFGLVERQCPSEPLAEFLDIKECERDSDCTPRICCTERGVKGKKYCRTPLHIIENFPGQRRIEQPFKNIVSYMQCTAPPKIDLFPKPCQSTIDCFPNLCCQENGKKLCRPPKKSILSVVADVATRIGATQAIRKGIERITR